MAALERKLLRDFLEMKAQMAAIAAVMASGVAMFVLMMSTLDSLEISMDGYYADYRFADVFAGLKRAPESLSQRIEGIPGVAQVETRVVAGVTLDVPGATEAVGGRLISLPETGQPKLNGVFLRRGRMPERADRDQVLVSEGFAEAHELEIGDRVLAVINGHREGLRIAGIALSPEYVYSIKPGAVMPDDRLFGVFWMRREALAAAFDMGGAFNDVSLALSGSANPDDVLDRLDRILDPHGGLGAYGRKNQVSNWYLQNEIAQLHGSAVFVPLIFLSVAAFLLNVVFSRVVQTQREQIAVLKAFGYGNPRVGLHYLEMVMLVVVAGGLIGVLAGAWMGRGMTRMYTEFFHFPSLVYELDVRYVIQAFVIGALAGTLGALKSIRDAVRLPPAEAMRPQAPRAFRPTLVERLGFGRILSPQTRMVLRHMERQPVKSTLSVLGLAMAVAIMILGSFTLDAIYFIMDVQFGIAQREDVRLNLVEPRAEGALQEIRHLPGVMHAEPFRAVAARLRYGHRSRRVGIQGLPSDTSLQRLVDENLSVVRMPSAGLVLTTKLASLLGVGIGDRVVVEVLEGRRPALTVPVSRVVESFIGIGAYMDMGALNRIMREGDTITGAQLLLDSSMASSFHAGVKSVPMITGVGLRREALASFEETIQESMGIMSFFNVLFATVIAVGVVYNNSRIVLAEHARELATMRVLGFSRAETSAVLLGELFVQTLLAVPVGLLMGFGLAAALCAAFDTELYRIPLVIADSTYATAAVTVMIAAIVSGLLVRRRLDRLDLMAALKTPE